LIKFRANTYSLKKALIAEVHVLQGLFQLHLLDQGDGGLQVVALLAGDP
jgi:hypothetical protein